MNSISGISALIQKEYAVFYIMDLTDQIKELLRRQLSFICYGQSASESGKSIYNYKNTLNEFIKRYENKEKSTQKGMIGELLAHLVINEYFEDYSVASPFFNLEERSIKKGFDVVLATKTDHSIWITEVKSGELHKNKDSNGTVCDLFDIAKRDLLGRLNHENFSLWMNAINGAKLVYEKNEDLKDAIVEVLEDYTQKSGIDHSVGSSDINVFLVGTLFSTLTSKVKTSIVAEKYNELNDKKLFKELFLLTIQKSTYEKVYQFLREESKV